jgi:hypothetical protein
MGDYTSKLNYKDRRQQLPYIWVTVSFSRGSSAIVFGKFLLSCQKTFFDVRMSVTLPFLMYDPPPKHIHIHDLKKIELKQLIIMILSSVQLYAKFCYKMGWVGVVSEIMGEDRIVK